MPFVSKQTIIRLLSVALVTLSGLAYVACDSGIAGSARGVSRARRIAGMQKASRLPWNKVRNWAYWLDNPDLKQLGASAFDLLVIDASADGSAAHAFNAQQIEMVRRANPQRRVVAYLSIGQAEISDYAALWIGPAYHLN